MLSSRTSTTSSTIYESSAEYWKSPPGILRRINMLSTMFTHRTVNNSLKIIGTTAGVRWLAWVLRPDKSESGPCKVCIGYAVGGDAGVYKSTWFLPQMPVHPNCVCEWELIYRQSDVTE